jgi:hypothetical protein
MSWGKRLGRLASPAFVVVLALSARADQADVTAAPGGVNPKFESQNTTATELNAGIKNRVKDIEQLQQQAAAAGQSFRASCIAQKLKRAVENEASAGEVMKGWELARTSSEFADRSIARLIDLSVYANVYYQEARGCPTVEQAGRRLEVEIKKGSRTDTQGTGSRKDESGPDRSLYSRF